MNSIRMIMGLLDGKKTLIISILFRTIVFLNAKNYIDNEVLGYFSDILLILSGYATYAKDKYLNQITIQDVKPGNN